MQWCTHSKLSWMNIGETVHVNTFTPMYAFIVGFDNWLSKSWKYVNELNYVSIKKQR